MGGSYPSTAVLIEVLLVSTDQQRITAVLIEVLLVSTDQQRITALKYVRFGARLDQP